MSIQRPQSFTRKFQGTTPILFTPAYIAQAFDSKIIKSFDPASHSAVQFKAIWDTGATNSVITQKVVDDCGLKPIGMAISHTAGGPNVTERYLVSLFLPNHVCVNPLSVTRLTISGDFEILIGMDVISKADFAVTQKGGSTKMSFRMPSMADIDFAAESRNAQKTGSQHLSRADRRRQKFGRK